MTEKDQPAEPMGGFALWIMTPFGPLYPAVRPPSTVPSGDPRTMQVRSRRREFLDQLRDTFCPELGETLTGEEVSGRKMDYPYRAYVQPGDLARAVAAMVLATDAESFKPLAEASRYALPDAELASRLHSVYTAMWAAQLELSDGTSSYDRSA